MEIDYSKIGKQVKKYRKMRGMSQEQLAEAVKITAKHVSSIENGRSKMSVDCLVAMANVLMITPNHLVADFVQQQQKQTALDVQWAHLIHECTIPEQKKYMKLFRAFVDIERG